MFLSVKDSKLNDVLASVESYWFDFVFHIVISNDQKKSAHIRERSCSSYSSLSVVVKRIEL